MEDSIPQPPSDREAVEYACSVLASNGVRDVNPEIFRRASLGREDVCAKLWKALHDVIVVVVLNLSPHQHPGNLLNADELGQRIDLAWKRLMEKVGEEFKFGTVVSFVLNKLLSFGCPAIFVRDLHKNQNTDSRSLLLALCYTVAKFSLLEKHAERLADRGGCAVQTETPTSKERPGDAQRSSIDAATRRKVPYLMRRTMPGKPSGDALDASVLGAKEAVFHHAPASALLHMYMGKKSELKWNMSNLKNAHIRYARAVEKYEAIAERKMTIEDPVLDLTTPLSYGLYINGRLHKNPMRVERIAKSLLLDLKDANYAMSCACVFWEWVNKIVFTNCADTVLQQCKDRILSKEKDRWTDGAIMTGRGSVSNGGQGTRTLRVAFVLNRAIQYIEEHLGHDVHYC